MSLFTRQQAVAPMFSVLHTTNKRNVAMPVRLYLACGRLMPRMAHMAHQTASKQPKRTNAMDMLLYVSVPIKGDTKLSQEWRQFWNGVLKTGGGGFEMLIAKDETPCPTVK